jgi:hypothetical protein
MIGSIKFQALEAVDPGCSREYLIELKPIAPPHLPRSLVSDQPHVAERSSEISNRLAGLTATSRFSTPARPRHDVPATNYDDSPVTFSRRELFSVSWYSGTQMIGGKYID